MSIRAAVVWCAMVFGCMALLLIFAGWLDRRDARKRGEQDR